MPATRVAVTGASGFVGRHVIAALQQHDVELTLGARRPDELTRLAAGCTVVELDIAQADEQAYAQLGRPDVLIHLAWGGLPNYRSASHLERELPAQLRFLEAMLAGGLPGLLVTGTCLEYGLRSGCLGEEHAPDPQTPYALAKDQLRRQLEAIHATRAFALCWARLFYMFGAGQSPQSLYAQLAAAVARGDRVFDMSGGQQLRDFLPVAEVADAIVRLALSGQDCGTVNICSGRPVSVRELVGNWLAENGWSIELNLGHYPYPDYEAMEFWGDRRKLDRLLRGET